MLYFLVHLAVLRLLEYSLVHVGYMGYSSISATSGTQVYLLALLVPRCAASVNMPLLYCTFVREIGLMLSPISALPSVYDTTLDQC